MWKDVLRSEVLNNLLKTNSISKIKMFYNSYCPAYNGAGEHLIISEKLSDLTIFVKSSDQIQWRFPAHKLMLSTQSAVFRQMLENDFSEKSTGEINIIDIKPHIMEMMLTYMYCGRAAIENWHDGLDLLRAAHKYQVDCLIIHCTQFLENVLTLSNVCNIYEDACLFGIASLKEKCFKLILDAGFILLRTKAFQRLNKDAVMEIVTNRELNIDTELMVFEALLRWAPMQCSRLNIPVTEENCLHEITPFLKYVCFDDMSDTEKSALPTAVLSCVRPNNRNRVPYHVNDSLVNYAHIFNFQVEKDCLANVSNQFNCLRFSLDTLKYLIGLKFTILVPHIPEDFSLFLVRESAGATTNSVSINMARVVWREGPQINECRRWETHVLLRCPWVVEERTVYKLYIEIKAQNVFCPIVNLTNKSVFTDTGFVKISVHSDFACCVMNLMFL